MSFGLDYVTGPPIADMKAANVEFVCRYIGYFSGYDDTHIATPQGKCLSPGEAKALMDAGINIVSNWEWDGLTPLKESGVWEAQEANKIHLACGGPPSRPIYFSVDTDADGSQVAAYFRGVASVIGLNRTGAYGSYRLLKYLFDNNLITWGWQTYAWSYGAWEPRAHIQQYQNGVSMSGHSVDFDRSIKSDYGQWGIGGTTVIAYNTPGVKENFTETDPHHWLCLQTGKIIQFAILDFYKKYGNSDLCGLTWLSLPLSNEIPLVGSKHGAVKQHYKKGVVFYDPGYEFDRPAGITGPVFLADIYSGQGQDPKIVEQQAQIVQLQAQSGGLQNQLVADEAEINNLKAQLAKATQPTGIDPAKVLAFQQAVGQAAKDGDAAIQSLVSQEIK